MCPTIEHVSRENGTTTYYINDHCVWDNCPARPGNDCISGDTCYDNYMNCSAYTNGDSMCNMVANWIRCQVYDGLQESIGIEQYFCYRGECVTAFSVPSSSMCANISSFVRQTLGMMSSISFETDCVGNNLMHVVIPTVAPPTPPSLCVHIFCLDQCPEEVITTTIPETSTTTEAITTPSPTTTPTTQPPANHTAPPNCSEPDQYMNCYYNYLSCASYEDDMDEYCFHLAEWIRHKIYEFPLQYMDTPVIRNVCARDTCFLSFDASLISTQQCQLITSYIYEHLQTDMFVREMDVDCTPHHTLNVIVPHTRPCPLPPKPPCFETGSESITFRSSSWGLEIESATIHWSRQGASVTLDLPAIAHMSCPWSSVVCDSDWIWSMQSLPRSIWPVHSTVFEVAGFAGQHSVGCQVELRNDGTFKIGTTITIVVAEENKPFPVSITSVWMNGIVQSSITYMIQTTPTGCPPSPTIAPTPIPGFPSPEDDMPIAPTCSRHVDICTDIFCNDYPQIPTTTAPPTTVVPVPTDCADGNSYLTCLINYTTCSSYVGNSCMKMANWIRCGIVDELHYNVEINQTHCTGDHCVIIFKVPHETCTAVNEHIVLTTAQQLELELVPVCLRHNLLSIVVPSSKPPHGLDTEGVCKSIFCDQCDSTTPPTTQPPPHPVWPCVYSQNWWESHNHTTQWPFGSYAAVHDTWSFCHPIDEIMYNNTHFTYPPGAWQLLEKKRWLELAIDLYYAKLNAYKVGLAGVDQLAAIDLASQYLEDNCDRLAGMDFIRSVKLSFILQLFTNGCSIWAQCDSHSVDHVCNPSILNHTEILYLHFWNTTSSSSSSVSQVTSFGILIYVVLGIVVLIVALTIVTASCIGCAQRRAAKTKKSPPTVSQKATVGSSNRKTLPPDRVPLLKKPDTRKKR